MPVNVSIARHALTFLREVSSRGSASCVTADDGEEASKYGVLHSASSASLPESFAYVGKFTSTVTTS